MVIHRLGYSFLDAFTNSPQLKSLRSHMNFSLLSSRRQTRTEHFNAVKVEATWLAGTSDQHEILKRIRSFNNELSWTPSAGARIRHGQPSDNLRRGRGHCRSTALPCRPVPILRDSCSDPIAIKPKNINKFARLSFEQRLSTQAHGLNSFHESATGRGRGSSFKDRK